MWTFSILWNRGDDRTVKLPSGNEATRQGSGIERGLEVPKRPQGGIGDFEGNGFVGQPAGPFLFLEMVTFFCRFDQ